MNIRAQISNYFRETLGVEVAPELWQPARRLPLFLRNGYIFYEMKLFSKPYLVMFDEEPDRSAAVVLKHINRVKEKWTAEIIYSKPVSNSDERRRLIEQKIPFVIPGNQLYLPPLGIDFREHFRKLHTEVEKFSPATEAALILLLTDKTQHSYSAQDLAERLGYSRMTMSKTLNELKSVEAVTKQGRARVLEYEADKQTLWENAKEFLASPVSQTHRIRADRKPLGVVAGLNALSRFSNLASPIADTIATTSIAWKEFMENQTTEKARLGDPEYFAVEVWTYDPSLFSQDGVADKFSIYLSLMDNPDERVEMALKEMMETVEW